MGKYISVNRNGVILPAKGKAQSLIVNSGATITDGKTFQPNLVCVVENSHFDAAGFAHDEREFNCFHHPSDTRPKTWLIVPDAEKLVD